MAVKTKIIEKNINSQYLFHKYSFHFSKIAKEYKFHLKRGISFKTKIKSIGMYL